MEFSPILEVEWDFFVKLLIIPALEAPGVYLRTAFY